MIKNYTYDNETFQLDDSPGNHIVVKLHDSTGYVGVSATGFDGCEFAWTLDDDGVTQDGHIVAKDSYGIETAVAVCCRRLLEQRRTAAEEAKLARLRAQFDPDTAHAAMREWMGQP